MKSRLTIAAVASLLLCAACADQPSQSASLAGPAHQQAVVQWDDIAAAEQVQVSSLRTLLR